MKLEPSLSLTYLAVFAVLPEKIPLKRLSCTVYCFRCYGHSTEASVMPLSNLLVILGTICTTKSVQEAESSLLSCIFIAVGHSRQIIAAI
jgi:hypothetical protein